MFEQTYTEELQKKNGRKVMVTVISRSLLLFLENKSFNYSLGINNAEIYDHWDYPFTSRGYLSRYWRGKPMDFRIQCYSAGRIIFVNICLGIFTRRLIDPDSHLGLCIQNNVYPISDHRRRFIRKKFNTLHAPEREKKIRRMNIVWRRRRQHPPPSPQKTRSYKWNKLPGCCGN